MSNQDTQWILNPCWYTSIQYNNQNITRTDFHISRYHRHRLIRHRWLAIGFAEYFKTQRLHQSEITEWNSALSNGSSLDAQFVQKIKFSLAEGVLKEDLVTVDEDAFIGTCGQLVFKWIRAQYFGAQLLLALPSLLTDSSKKQGIDYFEILGDLSDPASLHFIVWEIKATDGNVADRTDEIYQMHKKRTPRLMRGLEMQLSLEYPIERHPVLGNFVQHLLDHWQENCQCKHLGGAIIYDTSNKPETVFSTFHQQFPDLHSSACRQVILIEIPKFRRLRKAIWNHLQSQMS